MNAVPVVHVAAAIILDAEGRALMVRKQGTATFMQPGGKPEPGERPVDTIRRELSEELRLELAEEDVEYLGAFESAAANEPGHRVRADAFRVHAVAPLVERAAEIAELRWIGPGDLDTVPVAPLSTEYLLPLAWDPHHRRE
ncbi:NUDIX domain-containing protein [uncultured Aeromicrobium sp.]|uniref:NUDIX hydrolase n=1 Tax=uncultured Aeromicrobium sp. TaxID=337820 RepID=UPI0025F66B78|nr:NUDIX domain-containing protein [uncultured Aeromicrobium sp.]